MEQNEKELEKVAGGTGENQGTPKYQVGQVIQLDNSENAWYRGYDNVINATIVRVAFANGEYWYRIAFKRGIQNAEENVQEAILDHYIIN